MLYCMIAGEWRQQMGVREQRPFLHPSHSFPPVLSALKQRRRQGAETHSSWGTTPSHLSTTQTHTAGCFPACLKTATHSPLTGSRTTAHVPHSWVGRLVAWARREASGLSERSRSVPFWSKNTERDNSAIAHPKSGPVCLDYCVFRCCRLSQT